MRYFVNLILLFFCLPLFCQVQDTCIITYDIGKTELTDAHKEVIDTFLHAYSEIDSLQFSVTGSADYLGNISFNQIISDRRVEGVIGYIQSFRAGSLFNTESKGEVNSHLEKTLGLTGQVQDRRP